jgi:hypothetical protein
MLHRSFTFMEQRSRRLHQGVSTSHQTRKEIGFFTIHSKRFVEPSRIAEHFGTDSYCAAVQSWGRMFAISWIVLVREFAAATPHSIGPVNGKSECSNPLIAQDSQGILPPFGYNSVVVEKYNREMVRVLPYEFSESTITGCPISPPIQLADDPVSVQFAGGHRSVGIHHNDHVRWFHSRQM